MGAREVAAGAEWLDSNFPGWEREIDLGSLDLSDCQNCVCGQSLRGFVEGNITSGYHAAVAMGAQVNDDWDWGPSFDTALEWAQKHGFAIEGDEEGITSMQEFAELDRLWRELIKERFNTGNLSDVEED